MDLMIRANHRDRVTRLHRAVRHCGERARDNKRRNDVGICGPGSGQPAPVPFPPLAVGFFGRGTGYLIYGPQELFGYPKRDERVDQQSVFATESLAQALRQLEIYGRDGLPVLSADGKQVEGWVTSASALRAIVRRIGTSRAEAAPGPDHRGAGRSG